MGVINHIFMLIIILACHDPLNKTVQPFPYPPNYPHIKTSLQFTEKDVLWDSVKDLTDAQIDDIPCSLM